MEKHSLIITQKKGVNTPIALVVHSNCIMEWDIIALLLGEDNLIHNFSDFIYYRSVIRCEMYGDIPDFNNCKASEYNKEKYHSKKHWRESTIPMSADGAVIGPIGSLYGYPCLGEETDNDEETDINDEYEALYIAVGLLNPQIKKIKLFVALYKETEGQITQNPFGDSYINIRISNYESGIHLLQYNVCDEVRNDNDVVEIGTIEQTADNKWIFSSGENGYKGDLQTLIDIYTS